MLPKVIRPHYVLICASIYLLHQITEYSHVVLLCSFCESIFPMLLIFGLILRRKAAYFLHLKVKVVVHGRRWLLIPDSSIEFFIETTNRTVKKVFQELGRAIRSDLQLDWLSKYMMSSIQEHNLLIFHRYSICFDLVSAKFIKRRLCRLYSLLRLEITSKVKKNWQNLTEDD